MARNRRAQSGGVRFGPLVTALLVSACFCAAGVGYVWHRNRNEQLSRLIRDRSVRLEELRAQNRYLDRQLEDLRSHRSLEARVRELNLGLVMPRPEQILRLPEPRGTAPAEPATAVPGPVVADRR